MPCSMWLKRLVVVSLSLAVLGGCSSSDDDDKTPAADGGTNNPDGGGTASGDCLGETFLESLGKDRLLVGAQMEDSTAASAPFDVHYLYIASGLVDSNNVCTSCTSGCSAGGTSCANGECSWWGCWQDLSQPPGDYIRTFVSAAAGRKKPQIPFITYYQQLLGSVGPSGEGEQQLTALNDAAVMRRYFADYRFTLQQVGSARALLHLEPDLWGYLQFFSNGNPDSVPAQVASANNTDCGGMANTASGLSRCMIAMARKYAPNAKVSLHASPWSTRVDVYLNTNASFDIAAEARKVADFLSKLGAADTDFIVVEASDRDAGFYDSIGEETWWDVDNRKLPHFRQAFTWAAAISERLGKPNFWWQLPVGNMSLPNNNTRWKDNRVDYFFSHTAELAAAHSVGFSFGAGEGRQTSPETDNGNLASRVRAYEQAGGQVPCVK
ncbi:hypothetical protein OWM54_27210 [Myxococcus sp. MISCRS1]|uniref:hypothetical protein n=1 Tax=Myxococcus TaxID=32 RepID=UPI00227059E0|nr:hypothetical protein [Myxococcus sp. MISCRS1]MCY1000845.1 hypothetical protein [Myxococcus sp. MISCRS1]